MRRGKVKYTFDAIGDLINLPDDVSLENIRLDFDRRTVTFDLSSASNPSLPECAEGTSIQEVNPFTANYIAE